MDAREYLEQIEMMDIKIKQRQKELLALKLSATGNGSLNISDKVKSSGSSSDKMSDTVIEYIELEEKIKKDIKRLNLKRNEIIGKIHKLNKKEYVEILFKKYVEYKSLMQIGEEMNFSYEYAKILHRKALKEFQNCTPKVPL